MLRKIELLLSRSSLRKYFLLPLLFFPLVASGYLINAKETPKEQTKLPKKENKGFHLGINVDLVMMYISAFNSSGHFVSGLEKNQFKVYEDGVEQQIITFAQEDVPVSMGILLDLSGSMKAEKKEVNDAALAFIRASNPEDQIFLIGFSDEAELLQDFTSDIDEIQDALENNIVTGGTVLYDAIYLGVQKAQKGIKIKKAVVVVTDGEDKDSVYKLDELIALVQEADVQVFCVGFLHNPPTKRNSASKKAFDALVRISEETGGKAFFPQKTEEIHNIVAEIAGELRSQYSIGYSSSNIARDGSFRRVKVSLENKSPDINLRYRRGYFAPKGNSLLSSETETPSRNK
jgi:Ca-activated chloride channel homolog